MADTSCTKDLGSTRANLGDSWLTTFDASINVGHIALNGCDCMLTESQFLGITIRTREGFVYIRATKILFNYSGISLRPVDNHPNAALITIRTQS